VCASKDKWLAAPKTYRTSNAHAEMLQSDDPTVKISLVVPDRMYVRGTMHTHMRDCNVFYWKNSLLPVLFMSRGFSPSAARILHKNHVQMSASCTACLPSWTSQNIFSTFWSWTCMRVWVGAWITCLFRPQSRRLLHWIPVASAGEHTHMELAPTYQRKTDCCFFVKHVKMSIKQHQ
jgi:hypothetical protein